ncbi:hypothetical protein RND81_11G030900 [Saponaria officinalis]|uniref:Uncharacterized protein n=1 Tax=Saponaria officinalis TaxID=3572 RepID=A0AAW1HJ05_SAPOF
MALFIACFYVLQDIIARFGKKEAMQREFFTDLVKHFEKDIVHAIEGSISVTSKEIKIVRRFAPGCSKYEADNHCTTSTLSETTIHVRDSRNAQ